MFRLVGKSALELCLWNMKVADEEDRKDLVKIWQIVELCIRAGRPRYVFLLVLYLMSKYIWGVVFVPLFTFSTGDPLCGFEWNSSSINLFFYSLYCQFVNLSMQLSINLLKIYEYGDICFTGSYSMVLITLFVCWVVLHRWRSSRKSVKSQNDDDMQNCDNLRTFSWLKWENDGKGKGF